MDGASGSSHWVCSRQASCRSFPTPPPPTHPVNDSITVHLQQVAVRSNAGDLSATNELARQMFVDAGIPNVLASSFGFTDRLANAEVEYRKGAHSSVTEASIVKAVNNMVATIGAPQWARTNVVEVRKLRMHMLVNNPELFANQGAADNTGHYKALGETMTPLEGSYVATALLYQKTIHPDYQFTEGEKAQNVNRDAKAVHAEQVSRTNELQDLLQGKTQSLSVRDLLNASDHFFSDLGVEPVPGAQTIAVLRGSGMQGGRR